MPQKLECYHHYTGPLIGPQSWLSKKVRLAFLLRRIVSTGQFGGVCDWRMPLEAKGLKGKRDVSCVGPNDPRCPDKKSAELIKIEDITTR